MTSHRMLQLNAVSTAACGFGLLAMRGTLHSFFGLDIHHDDRPGLLDTWRRVLEAGQPKEAEARFRRFDGEYRWYLIRMVPIRDESGALLGVVRDEYGHRRSEAGADEAASGRERATADGRRHSAADHRLQCARPATAI